MNNMFARSSKWLSVWLTLTCVAITNVQATTAPAVSVLPAFADSLTAPTRVATDVNGNTYVVDTSSGRVIIFDVFNHQVAEKSGLQSPLGIAVDRSGNIYLGNAETGSVSIFDSQWNLIAKLGLGDGEFNLPNYIALDEGTAPVTVYVSDSPANTLKAYQNGVLVRSLGGPNANSAKFDFPAGVWVNASGDVFCADQNHTRILVFDRSGAFVRSFNMGLWNTPGFMGRPAGVTGNNKGRIFVADTFQDFVKVFDEQGNLLSTFSGYGEDAGQLRSPAGITLDSRGRLLIASPNNARVEVFGLDGFTLLASAPEGLTAAAGDSRVTLSWSALDGATSYNIKRSATSGGPYTNLLNVTSTNCTDLSVSNGTNYFYVVSGVNIYLESPVSTEASARPVSMSPPALAMSLTDGQLQCSWPADHLGWRLQMNTNLSENNWVDVPATDLSTGYSVPATNNSLFFRMVFP